MLLLGDWSTQHVEIHNMKSTRQKGMKSVSWRWCLHQTQGSQFSSRPLLTHKSSKKNCLAFHFTPLWTARCIFGVIFEWTRLKVIPEQVTILTIADFWRLLYSWWNSICMALRLGVQGRLTVYALWGARAGHRVHIKCITDKFCPSSPVYLVSKYVMCLR